MVPQAPDLPAEAVLATSLRIEQGKEAILLVAECDARNYVAPVEPVPPFELEFQFGPPDAAPAAGQLPPLLVFTGRRDEGPLAGRPEDLGGLAAPQLELRPDGLWRVTLALPAGRLPPPAAAGEAPELLVNVTWRLAGPVSPEGRAEFPPTATSQLVPAGELARLVLRPPRPTDVRELLQAYASAPGPACGHRCLMRLFRLCGRDDTLRGALAMAMEHEDPLLRTAAARVWREWPDDGSDNLAALKNKARELLEVPPP
jgi:hypothetical protein